MNFTALAAEYATLSAAFEAESRASYAAADSVLVDLLASTGPAQDALRAFRERSDAHRGFCDGANDGIAHNPNADRDYDAGFAAGLAHSGNRAIDESVGSA